MFRNEADCNMQTASTTTATGMWTTSATASIPTTTTPTRRDDYTSTGTHVAGHHRKAVGHNNLGVAGVNWHVRLMPCKFLNSKRIRLDLRRDRMSRLREDDERSRRCQSWRPTTAGVGPTTRGRWPTRSTPSASRGSCSSRRPATPPSIPIPCRSIRPAITSRTCMVSGGRGRPRS